MASASMAQRGEDNPDGPYKSRQGSGSSDCTEYRLSAFGGDAGFRVMKRPGDFRRISNGSVRGKICDGGSVRVELAKRHPDTQVSLDIAGREYTFGQGDRGDKLENSWFRQYFTIDLSQHSTHYHHSQPDAQYGYYHDPGEFTPWAAGYPPYDHYQSDTPYYGPVQQYQTLPQLHVDSKAHRRAHRRGAMHDHLEQDLAWY
jgi:hypothetical protein